MKEVSLAMATETRPRGWPRGARHGRTGRPRQLRQQGVVDAPASATYAAISWAFR
jgi:hypothetical protein